MKSGEAAHALPLVVVSGAGADVGAGVPHAKGMLDGIEAAFGTDGDLIAYASIYAEIKRVIVRHLFLRRRELGENARIGPEERAEYFYGFEHLVDWLRDGVAIGIAPGRQVAEVRDLVRHKTENMLSINDSEDAAHYLVLPELQAVRPRSIHLFTVNLSLCPETLHGPSFPVVTGFGGHGVGFYWSGDWFLVPGSPRGLYAYKFHGSVNWRDFGPGRLCALDPSEPIDISKARIVLGREPKRNREFPEPYEFYMGRFRDLSRLAREVYVVGYGFGDREINEMLREFALGDFCDRLIVVTKFGDVASREEETGHIRRILGGSDKVRVVSMRAERLRGTIDRWLPLMK